MTHRSTHRPFLARLVPLVASVALVAACGGKGASDATPAAPATTSAATATATPADTAGAPGTAAAADTEGTIPTMAGDGEWLVWVQGMGKNGFPTYTTTWIKAGADRVEEVATRPEAVVSDGGHLLAVRETWTAIQEFACPEDLEFDNYPKPGQKPDATTTLPKVDLVDLLGGEKRPLIVELREPGLVSPKGIYIGSVDAHWELQGSANGVLFWREVLASYDCGAHGDSAVTFVTYDLAKGEVRRGPVLDAQLTAIEAKIPELMKTANAALAKRSDDAIGEGNPGELFGWELLAKGGKIQVFYQVAHGTSWAGTDSEAGGYSMSEFVGADTPIPELGLGEIPLAVKVYAAQESLEGSVGWSSLAGLDREKAFAAFKDAATVPTELRPGRVEGGEARTGAAKSIDQGRKATKAKDYPAAIAAFDQAIAADAKAPTAYSGRGYAKLLAKDFDGSKADFEKALELGADPKFQATVWFNLGLVAEGTKDVAGAKAAFGKSLTLRPSKAVQRRLDALSK